VREPEVSVVLPTRDRAHLVGRAIRSVLAQTARDLELIVVDDASTDGTAVVVAAFADRRIRALRLDAHGGHGRSRNAGLQAAAGEWVAFLDSDDEWRPEKLESQLRRARETEATVVYCGHRLVLHGPGGPDRGKASSFPEGSVLVDLLRGWDPPTSAFTVKRAVLDQVGGFDEQLACSNDWDLWLRLAVAGHRFAAVPAVLVDKHQLEGPQVSSDPRARRDGFRTLDRKWGRLIIDTLGRPAYRRWRRHRLQNVQYALFMRAREVAATGDPGAVLRDCLAMARLLPWSRRYLVHGLGLLLLGRSRYDRLAALRRHIAWSSSGQ
jgi:glycosyltransferase involved in cell wall biosynthesis